MKKLLRITALGEVTAGFLFLAFPSLMIRLLFAEEPTGAGAVMSRIAGISLLGLGVACWPDGESVRGYYGMFTFNAIVALYLAIVGIGGQVGILLWPAVVLHAGVSALLAWTWRKKQKIER